AQLLAQHQQNCEVIHQMSGSISELENQLTASQQEGASLMHQLSEIQRQLCSMQAEKCQLGERIRLYESDVLAKQTGILDLEKELAEKASHIVGLLEQIDMLQVQLASEQQNHQHSKSALNLTQTELGECKQDLNCKTKNISKLEQDVQKLTRDNMKLDEIEGLTSEMALLKENNQTLIEEKQATDEALQGRLVNKEKAMTDLESKNKSLKSDISTKNKQIKDLEKETKSLKSKVASSSKLQESRDSEVERLRGELEQLETRRAELEQGLERLTHQTETANKQAEEMKSLAKQCAREKEEAVRSCEGQRAEMIYIMEGYKADNDKMLADKQKELDTVRAQVEALKKKKDNEADKKIAKLQAEIDLLRKTVSVSGHEMENMQRNVGEKENKLQELEKENMKKDEELKGLQQQLEKMFIKNTASTVVQTSPFKDSSSTSDQSVTPKHASKLPTYHDKENKKPGGDDEDHVFRSVPKTPIVPRTPLVPKSPYVPRSSFVPNTPSVAQTPQRSILKPLSANSAIKKRRVVFASKEEEEASNSEDSCHFEVMDIDIERNKSVSSHVLVLQSPKPGTPECKSSAVLMPLHRTPRTPNEDSDKKRHKTSHTPDKTSVSEGTVEDKSKTKTPSTRKAPVKSSGKFFKNSPKDRMASFREAQKDKDLSWFESSDVFGFGIED
ncbi:hypothetical protein DPMN_055621, partial [Dreissena polymorpha]